MPFVIDTIQAGTIDVSQAITVNGQTVTPGGGGLPYKVYTASLTQVLEENPTAVVLENTLGFDVNWVRDEAGGLYVLTLPSGTDITKIFILLGLNTGDIAGINIVDKSEVQSIQISTGEDNLLDKSGIEIRIYP